MNNKAIADIFREIANILEIKGANVFRIRAYQKAAQNIEGLSEDLASIAQKDRLLEIPGIGKELSEHIQEFLQNGKVKIYEDLKKSLPVGLLDLLNIPSVGPKTVKLLYERIKVKNISDLEKAIKTNKLIGLPGIKEKTIDNIKKGIGILSRSRGRLPLSFARSLADEFIDKLKKLPEVEKISPAGSLRRQKESIGDIDILIASHQPAAIMNAFVKLPLVKDISVQGPTKASVRTKNDTQVDCRVVENKSYGAALVYFTGSKNFNIKLRKLAIKAGFKVNEYGIYKNDKFLCGRTEEEVFKKLGMSYVEPELREDNGEIELALKNKLPKLIELKDIKGDLHAHSNWSDADNTIEEMALSAQALGLSYIAITDHSQSLKVANGVSVKDLLKKKKEIDAVNKKLKNFTVLYGTEVDIDSSGRIDYKDEILKSFDIVVGAIHTGFKQSKEQLTKRIVRACQNKYVNIISHPTGRLWGSRDAYELDFEQILKVCHDTNTALEINAYPDRLDLNDLNARRAKEKNVKIAINTDSHQINQLTNMRFGIAVARRAWLTKNDVLNTLTLEQLLKVIRK